MTVMTRPAPSRIKHLLAIAAMFLIPIGAEAAGLRMTVEHPHFTCEGRHGNLSHVAFRPGDLATDAPLPCCDGQLGCAQFLSTNTIVRQPREWRG